MTICRECDVLVVGGGPAGSTIAGLLAQRHRRVVLLEKDHFPRFHIGESLLPLNLPLFDRLGVADQIRHIGVYKPGAELVSDEHDAVATFRFADNPFLSVGYSYQVRRSEFDKLLLDNSRQLGAHVFECTRVTDVTLDAGDRATVFAIGPHETSMQWSTRFLVDASGRDTLLSGRLGIKRIDKQQDRGDIRTFPEYSAAQRRQSGNDYSSLVRTCVVLGHSSARRCYKRRCRRNAGALQGEDRQAGYDFRARGRRWSKSWQRHDECGAVRPARRVCGLFV